MQERGVSWIMRPSSTGCCNSAPGAKPRAIAASSRCGATGIKVKDQWRDRYRVVDKTGQTMDCLLTDQRDEPAVRGFLTQAIRRHGVPETITIDRSEAHAAIQRTTRRTAR
jgi:putative transposase